MKTLGEGCRMRREGPKIEAEGRERGWVLEEGQQAFCPPARGSGSAVSSLSRVRGRAPTAQRFSTIFSTQDGLSRYYNIVKIQKKLKLFIPFNVG